MDEPYDIPADDDALLAECRVNTFRSTGHGGQSVNTTDSAVRLRHVPTGEVVVARRERSQYLNKRAALGQLRTRLEARNAAIARGEAIRKPQTRSRASREGILADKRQRSSVKRTRARVSDDQDG
jgi:protein subunit release factor A